MVVAMPIRELTPLIINQIAAGEVVERPASVVKELIENAFDAGATRIEIDLEGGGRDRIRVIDNGSGISAEELHLAVAPHATSKIVDLDDLEAVLTMGFRGEALASIASVSRLALTSRVKDDDEGWLLEVEGASIAPPRPTAAAVGTTIDVKTLFFNTPARRRFLKSERAETARVSETVRTLALSRPGVAMTLRSEGRVLVDLASEDDPARRVAAVLGETNLLSVHGEVGLVSEPMTYASIWGLIGKPEVARPTSRGQRIVLNGRSIVDRSLSHAIKEAFRGLIEPGKHPVAALFLDVDPRTVDVNVHPAKTEIRFRESRALFSLIKRSIEQALHETDVTPDLAPTRVDAPVFAGTRREPARKSWSPGFDFAEAEAVLPQIRRADEVLQVHGTFLVTQDETGLIVIDQHALHERVMFEKLKNRVEAGTLESQHLATPSFVEVDPLAVAAIESLAPLLERLGIDARPAGPRSVAVHAFPSLLFARKVDPVEFIEDLLERAAAGTIGPADSEAALSEVLDMMSCKAAIKAGDRLSQQEIGELLEQRDAIDRGSSCPHGRPTHLRIPIDELERRFGRSPAGNRR